MRERSISAVGVVLVGLVPTIVGGPIFAAVFAALCLIAVAEYGGLTAQGGHRVATRAGYLAVAGFAFASLFGLGAQGAIGIAALATGLPLIAGTVRQDLAGAFVTWALGVAGAFYLGIPTYAAIALRQTEGDIEAAWLRDLAAAASPGWDGAERGLAWLLVVILATWLGDTAAYLIGRSLGRRPLAPRISPKKTVEGAIGGLGGSALAGGLGVALFGLGVHPLLGVMIGIALGLLGQVGDLAESMLKRQAGVKDSGTLIPGHGGILDRMDALLFAVTGGWFIATAVDRLV